MRTQQWNKKNFNFCCSERNSMKVFHVFIYGAEYVSECDLGVWVEHLRYIEQGELEGEVDQILEDAAFFAHGQLKVAFEHVGKVHVHQADEYVCLEKKRS